MSGAAAVITLLCLLFSAHSHCTSEQSNCTECYQDLVKELMYTADNEYLLSTTFFPILGEQPNIVTVDYCFVNATLKCKKWFWTKGKIYLFQPPRVLQFISLLFSDPPIRDRIGEVTLELPNHCESVKDEFMEALTQRLKLYAQYPDDNLVIPDSYNAKAYSIDTIQHKLYKSPHTGVNRVDLIYCTHFLFPFSVTVIFVIIVWAYADTRKKELNDNPATEEQQRSQVTLATTACLSILFTLFVIVMDLLLLIFAYAFESNTASHDLFFTSDDSLFFFPAVVAVSEIIAVHFIVIYFIFGPMPCISAYTWMQKLFMASVLCAFLCLSVHFPFILSSWTTDSFHSLSILLWYVGIVTIDFLACKFVFELMLSRRRNAQVAHAQLDILCTDFIWAFICLISLSLPQANIIAYYTLLPFNMGLENASQALNSSLQVFAAVFTTLIAWKVLKFQPPWPQGHYTLHATQ